MPNVNADGRSRERLAAAFAAADYLVEAGDATLCVRIGRPQPELDRRVAEPNWAIVTAYNPGATPASARANRESDALLFRRLQALRPSALLRCRNRDPKHQWPDEPGWLFAPASAHRAIGIAREFAQLAVVLGRAGHAAMLRFTDQPIAPEAGSGAPS
jgi:hypothetical protein